MGVGRFENPGRETGGSSPSIDVHAVVNAAELERRLAPAEQTNQPDPNARVIRPAEYY
jgi:hypothetical protein